MAWQSGQRLGPGPVVMMVCAALVLSETAFACEIRPQEQARVTAIADERTVTLEDARPVRLAGLAALDGTDGEAAAGLLSQLVLGQTVTLGFARRKTDRYGRLLAYMATSEGILVQSELLTAGLARVETTQDTRDCARRFLADERRARSAGRGLWSKEQYRVRETDNLWDEVGTFQIVEGRVMSAANLSSGVYLNFGRNWRTDFTVFIDRSDLRHFRSAEVDPVEWEDRTIRVRGWLAKRNGPLIAVTHPEQIEWAL